MITSAMTRKELAERCGVSRVALNKWERDGAPVADALTWTLDEAFELIDEWRKKNKRPRYNTGADSPEREGSQQELIAAQTRNQNAAADRKEIENEVRIGQLVERAEIISEFADLLSQAKPLLESLVDDIATETPDDLRVKHRLLARNAVDRFFKKLASWKPPAHDA